MEIRSFVLGNNSRVFFKKNPRFGTWSVSFERGAIPQILSGEWQFFSELFDRVNIYLRHREKSKTEIKEEING
jgi:hypothetical protein